jgi:hypothetical protein
MAASRQTRPRATLVARTGSPVAHSTGATTSEGSSRWSVKASARAFGYRTLASKRCAGERKNWCTFQATMYTLSSESPT